MLTPSKLNLQLKVLFNDDQRLFAGKSWKTRPFTHVLHIWNIYQHIGPKITKCRWIYHTYIPYICHTWSLWVIDSIIVLSNHFQPAMAMMTLEHLVFVDAEDDTSCCVKKPGVKSPDKTTRSSLLRFFSGWAFNEKFSESSLISFPVIKTLGLCRWIYPLVMTNIPIENDHL